MANRTPYKGRQRKLLIALDVGTTFSGVSYSILEPGKPPETFSVNRFPAQIHGHSKIPSVLYYDADGVAHAIGAEAVQDGIEEIAKDSGWTKAAWFKLHLHPKVIETAYITVLNKNPLPEGIPVVNIFADLLRYLYRCTKEYFEQSHTSGDTLWVSLQKDVHFVLTHPNGWGGFQQSQMKEAALKAGLVPDMDTANTNISFVTEGEASLNYCICNGLSKDAFKNGKGVVIVDAGGGTIDISAYAQTSPLGNSYEEIAASRCYVKGSVFVTDNAESFLRDHLHGSDFSAEEEIKRMVKEFDERTKLSFRRSEDALYIKFGGLRDTDPSRGITSGQLKLAGSDVARFFAPSLHCILEAILEMRQNATTPISSVFLVGGFAGSDYLYKEINVALQHLGIDVSRPEGHLNKAVASGAISFYVDHYVEKRIVKVTYGNPCSYIYNPHDPEHLKRVTQVYESQSKKRYIRGAFDVIVRKGTQVSETEEFRRSYWYTSTTRDNMHHIKNEIFVYRGSISNPSWMDIDKDSYFKLCVVEANTTRLSQLLEPQQITTGKRKNKRTTFFYELKYDIILSLGLTVNKAEIAWKENGREVRSTARLVYDPLDN
ncbi:hypothetical protein F5887DRAFT_218796 [Amanita rubescens]|nr:hypothetical protein F5887DRAFT_218796 [Amanita rubescens]